MYLPGLGPGRVRSPTFRFCCNICYVCSAKFGFSDLLATCVMSVAQLLHFLISLQHVSRLFSIFYNFCYSCCTLFGQLLFIVEKVRAQGGLSGSPWAQASLLVLPFGGTFFTHNFVQYHLLQNVRSLSKHVPKMIPKSTKHEAPNRYTFLLCLFVGVSGLSEVRTCVWGNHFGHKSHGTQNEWKNRQKRYTNTPRKHD